MRIPLISLAMIGMLWTCAPRAAAAATAPSFSVNDVSCVEGKPCVFVITKSAKALSYSKITFTTHGGRSATYGVDFQPVTVTLTFANSELSKSVSVPTLEDTTVEAAEQFGVGITAVRFATISRGSGTGTIIDNDVAPPPPPPPPPPPSIPCPDGSMVPATGTCPSPPPPPAPIVIGSAVKAVTNCNSLIGAQTEVLVVGNSYKVVGSFGYSQIGAPASTPGQPSGYLILNDATHRGDGAFGLWVPIDCVVAQ